MDGGYVSRIHISNVLITGPLVVRPTLYMADGTPYRLQSVRVPTAGVYEINVNEALYAAPPAIVAHLSDYGSATLSYQHESAGHLLAFTEIIDVRPSVIFTEPFAGIDERSEGTQSIEGLWWRHTPDVHGFVFFSNVTSQPIQVSFEPTGSLGTALTASAVTLPAHATQMLDLDSLVSGLSQAENQAGGLRVQYTGKKRAVMLGGGLVDENIGYSASIPFSSHDTDPASAPTAITSASVGFMVGKPDPGMGFPPTLRFTPYAVLRNTTAQPLSVSPALYYMSGGLGGSSPVSMNLPAQQLKPFETRRLDLASIMANQGLVNFNGDINLTFSLTGRGGDLGISTGSVDQTGNYVFPVLAEAVGRSFSKGISHWTVSNGLDSMYSLWNPTDSAQDFVMTLHYGDGSGQYVKPIHLAARASVMIDVGMLLMEHEPDVSGNLIPEYIQEGTVTFSNPKGPTAWMTLAVCGASYNPRKGTCFTYWTYCYGYDYPEVEANPWAAAVQGTTQLTLYGTNADGSQTALGATWTSNNTPVATVGSSTGLVSGVSPGSATMLAETGEMVVYAGDLCAGVPVPCPTGNLGGSSGGSVVTVQVTNADIVSDQIAVTLAPSGLSGPLTVTLSGPAGSATPVSNQTESSGTYTFSFKPTTLPIGVFNLITAQWTVAGTTASGTKSYTFRVLGQYRHSQYNTPVESNCILGLGAATESLGPPNCTFSSINMKNDFISQSWLNGSGIAIAFGTEQNEAVCTYPPNVTQNVFRPVSAIVPFCGGSISNSTVAADLQSINHPLQCADRVLIVGLGGGTGTVKTVTDRCPACKGLLQLDNYNTGAACRTGAFVDLGNFTTIKVP